MCGILGGTNKKWNFESAVNVLKHRGPDSEAVKSFPDFTLGFTRLAIIDLSLSANQPMSSLDDKVHIVFNGEIYGFADLRRQLKSEGFHFRTQSDTEVLLNAYLYWGDLFVEHIDGMFAIGIYDLRKNQIKLFRDRPGIKPLYYLHDNKDFAFSSELKGLQTLCHGYNFEYDNTAIYDYFTYFYIPDPKSLYKNVYKLKPGHKLIFDLNTNKILENSPYWKLNPDPDPKPISIDVASEQLRSLIQESVKNQMIADVPVGFFLSGGMDSSIVVAESSNFSNQLKTFSVGFDDPKHTETPYAQTVADRFNTHHQNKTLSHKHNEDLLNNFKNWYDEPFADISAIPTYLVSKFAKENVTVVLTGDGGDELFGGYNAYHRYGTISKLAHRSFLDRTQFLRHLAKLKKHFKVKSTGYRLFSFLSHLTSDDLLRYSKILGMMDPYEKSHYARALNIPKDYDDFWFLRQYKRKELSSKTQLQYIDFHTYLPCDILTKVDRVSMAVSLEARVPLLSRKLIEFSFSLPEETRFYNNQLKGFLRESYKNIIPKAILQRPKKGFSVPLKYINLTNERHHESILRNVFGINVINLINP